MSQDFAFYTTRTAFDENYTPSDNSRITTNFANLARGDEREQNLRGVLAMINNRFNDLAHWDNPGKDRYRLELEIVSVELHLTADGNDERFPLIEILDTVIVDNANGQRISGIVGNNFSSYIRDYDFSVLLPSLKSQAPERQEVPGFGQLHGNVFKSFLASAAYTQNYTKTPVICISVSSKATYHRLANAHPVLGVEYRQDDFSLTDQYFAKMGLRVRYFMPQGSVAPYAFYFQGDLLNDYTNLELIGTISTMEAFQKIYRPEIYNANSSAAAIYKPSLENQDYSRTQIAYDREERTQLGIRQGKFTEERLMKPFGDVLEKLFASSSS